MVNLNARLYKKSLTVTRPIVNLNARLDKKSLIGQEVSDMIVTRPIINLNAKLDKKSLAVTRPAAGRRLNPEVSATTKKQLEA